MRIALFVGGFPTLTEAWLIDQVAGLIVVSDFAIRVLLGPGWEKSAQLFSILGFVGLGFIGLGFIGLIQPSIIAQHWAYIACQRTRALVAIYIVQLLAVVVGSITPVLFGGTFRDSVWIAAGVAACLVLVALPVQIWHTSRCTHLSAGDVLRALVPVVGYARAASAGTLTWRQFLAISHGSLREAAVGLGACGLASLAACGLVYTAIPELRAPVRLAIEMAPGPVLGRFRSARPAPDAAKDPAP